MLKYNLIAHNVFHNVKESALDFNFTVFIRHTAKHEYRPPFLGMIAALYAMLYTTNLGLKAPRLPAASGTLELSSLRNDPGASVASGHSRSRPEVSARLASSPFTRQQDSILALGRTESQLVESYALPAAAQDALASLVGETLGGNGQLGHLEIASIVSNAADHHADLSRTLGLRHQLCLK